MYCQYLISTKITLINQLYQLEVFLVRKTDQSSVEMDNITNINGFVSITIRIYSILLPSNEILH
jgi:hypothetical protein